MATQSGGSINSLFKKYYGRDASADERSYWANKSAFALRDALIKVNTGSKIDQINKYFQDAYGRNANSDEINYWKNRDFDKLQKQLKESSAAINHVAQKQVEEASKKAEEVEKTYQKQIEEAGRKAEEVKKTYEDEWNNKIVPWLAKEKQKQVDQYQRDKDRLDKAYQTAIKQGDRDKAIYIQRINKDYTEQLKSYSLNINKVEQDFKTAISEQNQDKIKNLNILVQDYTTANTRLSEDRQVRFNDIDRLTGQQLKANEVNYAERGLYRSGGRLGAAEYVGEEAKREKGVYQTAFERQQADLKQNKQRGTKAINTIYSRNVGQLKSGYNYNKAQLQAQKSGYNTSKARRLQDQANTYGDWRGNLNTTYQQNMQDLQRSWTDYLDTYRHNLQEQKPKYVNQGNLGGWNPNIYQRISYQLPTYQYKNKQYGK